MDPLPWIDAHTHLDHFAPEQRPRALEEIDAGPIWTLSNVVHLDSYRDALAAAGGRQHVLTGLAVHPWEAAGWAGRLDEFEPLLDEPPFYGELGLDYHWVEDADTYPAQRQVFAYFLEAAARRGKLVNLHTKGAEGDVLELLDRYRIERAIIHWYSGPPDIFRALVERGYSFTIGLEVLFSDLIREYARAVPLDQLLTETDGPTTLEWMDGETSWPASIERVTREVARLRDIPLSDLRAQLAANLHGLFPQFD